MNLNWQNTLTPPLNAALLAWLQHEGSFMQRLREFGIKDTEITVITHELGVSLGEYAGYFGREPQEKALQRKVWIHNGNQTWMYAETLIPEACLQGVFKPLISLGASALGTILFSLPEVKRTTADFAYLDFQSAIYGEFTKRIGLGDIFIPARRSKFECGSDQLMLIECFSPTLVF